MIVVERYHPMNKGSLLGFLDIIIEPWKLEVRGLTVWQKDGRRWFNMPSKEYQDKESGETKYSDVVRFTDSDWHKNFMQSLTQAFDAYCSEHGE